MKTVNKKETFNKESLKSKEKKYLIDHPSGHEILSANARLKNREFISEVIKLKSNKDRKNKSISSLASSIGLCLSLLLVIWGFEVQFPEEENKVDLNNTSTQFEDLVDIPLTQQVQKPPVQIAAPTIVEVNDEEIIEDIEVNLDIEMNEDTRIEEVVMPKQVEEMPEEKADEIFTIVEQRPEPYGGMKAFYEFVSDNLKYPPKATRMGVEGRVFVEFIVEKDGSLTDINVAKGIGGGCDEEAVRVISSAPKWNPGRQRGNAVRVRMIIPIVFKLYTTE